MSRHEDYMKIRWKRARQAGKEAYSGNVLDMVNSPPHTTRQALSVFMLSLLLLDKV